MTKILKNSEEYKTLFLNRIEKLDTPEAKAILPFFKLHSPSEIYRAIDYSFTFVGDSKKDKWNDWLLGVRLNECFLNIFHSINKVKFIESDKPLQKLLEDVFDELEEFEKHKFLTHLLKSATSNNHSSVDNIGLDVIYSLATTFSYFYTLSDRRTTQEIFTKII